MRLTSFFLMLMITVALLPGAAQKSGSSSSYETLAQRAKQGDTSVDFRALRLAYADSPNFNAGPDTSGQKKAMFEALKAGKFAEAVKASDVVLSSNYVDMDAHYGQYVAYRELKQAEEAALHKAIFQGLLKSITDSGDGKSPETAYQVIEVHEEYVLLRTMGVGLPKSQSLLRKNGHAFDEITFDDPQSKQESKIYFNVDIPIKHGL